MAYRAPTPQDIALVEAKRRECASQFNLSELVASMLRFYNLLITIGHWPLNSLHIAPHQNPHIDTSLAERLNFSSSACLTMQSLPYPSERLVYDQDRSIFERTRNLNFMDPEDLENARYPARDYDSPPLPNHILALMMPCGAEGSTVLLDTELGAIYYVPWDLVGYRAWYETLEYRVARQLNAIPEAEDWFMFDPGPQARHEYLPFTPAKQWFDKQYELWRGMKRLPFLDPRYDGDRDMSLDELGPPGDWRRGLTERKQVAMVELMERHGWPDETRWDRQGFLRAWEGLQVEFKREQRARMEEMEEMERERERNLEGGEDE